MFGYSAKKIAEKAEKRQMTPEEYLRYLDGRRRKHHTRKKLD
jgi:hypothetical protein